MFHLVEWFLERVDLTVGPTTDFSPTQLNHAGRHITGNDLGTPFEQLGNVEGRAATRVQHTLAGDDDQGNQRSTPRNLGGGVNRLSRPRQGRCRVVDRSVTTQTDPARSLK